MFPKTQEDIDAVIAAAQESMFGLANPGFCRKCGAEHDSVEPDAEGYPCAVCGEDAVTGAETLLIEVL